jgi:two-component system cell cycle response regulator
LDDNRTLKLEKIRSTPLGTKHATLIVLQGTALGTSIPLNKHSLIIGRGSDCDLRVDDNLASRQHACVQKTELPERDPVYNVEDLGSTNGTFVNGKVTESSHPLVDGDKIRVGRHLFKFAWLDETESAFQERIEQLIIRDDLTNLLTQRSFFIELDSQVSRRNDGPAPERGTLFVLMLDLDHFKRVNDTYGHLVGSQTIKEVGQVIEGNLRGQDFAGRYGGEEYIALLQDLTPEQAAAVAERLRASIEQHEVTMARKGSEVRLHVTISIGVSAYPRDSDASLDLIEKADLALYRGKKEGRNRVVKFDPDRDRLDDEGYQRLDLSGLLLKPAQKA